LAIGYLPATAGARSHRHPKGHSPVLRGEGRGKPIHCVLAG
jgi:hypothetical protein